MVTPGSLQFTPRHAPRAASVFETCPAAVPLRRGQRTTMHTVRRQVTLNGGSVPAFGGHVFSSSSTRSKIRATKVAPYRFEATVRNSGAQK